MYRKDPDNRDGHNFFLNEQHFSEITKFVLKYGFVQKKMNDGRTK